MTPIPSKMIGQCDWSKTGWSTWTLNERGVPFCRCAPCTAPIDEQAASDTFDEWYKNAHALLDPAGAD